LQKRSKCPANRETESPTETRERPLPALNRKRVGVRESQSVRGSFGWPWIKQAARFSWKLISCEFQNLSLSLCLSLSLSLFLCLCLCLCLSLSHTFTLTIQHTHTFFKHSAVKKKASYLYVRQPGQISQQRELKPGPHPCPVCEDPVLDVASCRVATSSHTRLAFRVGATRSQGVCVLWTQRTPRTLLPVLPPHLSAPVTSPPSPGRMMTQATPAVGSRGCPERPLHHHLQVV
jgi:hypothetical protein